MCAPCELRARHTNHVRRSGNRLRVMWDATGTRCAWCEALREPGASRADRDRHGNTLPAVCESAGEAADAARDRRRVLASTGRYVRCPRASPIAGAEYRLAGAALCHSPRGDTRTGASHYEGQRRPTHAPGTQPDTVVRLGGIAVIVIADQSIGDRTSQRPGRFERVAANERMPRRVAWPTSGASGGSHAAGWERSRRWTVGCGGLGWPYRAVANDGAGVEHAVPALLLSVIPCGAAGDPSRSAFRHANGAPPRGA